MRNVTIVNFSENAERQYSDNSFRIVESDVIFLNNGLAKAATNSIRDFFDRIKASGKNGQLIEHSKKSSSGQLIHDAIMTVLNDLNVKYLTYVDDASSGKVLDASIMTLEEYPALACGGKPYLKKTLFDYTSMTFVPREEELKIPICLSTRTLKPTWTLSPPWTINLDLFRKGSNNIAAFQIISRGFQMAFEQGEIDFEALFAHLYVAFVQPMNPKLPLLSQVP